MLLRVFRVDIRAAAPRQCTCSGGCGAAAHLSLGPAPRPEPHAMYLKSGQHGSRSTSLLRFRREHSLLLSTRHSAVCTVEGLEALSQGTRNFFLNINGIHPKVGLILTSDNKTEICTRKSILRSRNAAAVSQENALARPHLYYCGLAIWGWGP